MKRSASKNRISEEAIEAKRGSVGSGLSEVQQKLVKSLWEDLLVGSVKTVPEQVLGKDKEEVGLHAVEELKEGVEVSLKKVRREEREIIKISSEHQEYFRSVEKVETASSKNEQMVMHERVKEILFELKKLAKSSKTMEVLFKEVTTQEIPINPGTYHLSFFGWLLSVVRNARTRIEEGANWLSMFASKKRQRQYWNMAKKFNTTFTLSGERTTATQTG
ncbi:MAG: hypothetical protein A2857_04995 [Candidatus Levybacteria bacterium RIFCSPHIGHO2_01_FULL_36_15]|nr:MAG: hypothetical protein A2857_04995 [Candidatus Levybacteria bacterium RIFCSPHIGHO2_01_FULL_36_15]